MLPSREYLPTIPLECACFTYRQVEKITRGASGIITPKLQASANKNKQKFTETPTVMAGTRPPTP